MLSRIMLAVAVGVLPASLIFSPAHSIFSPKTLQEEFESEAPSSWSRVRDARKERLAEKVLVQRTATFADNSVASGNTSAPSGEQVSKHSRYFFSDGTQGSVVIEIENSRDNQRSAIAAGYNSRYAFSVDSRNENDWVLVNKEFTSYEVQFVDLSIENLRNTTNQGWLVRLGNSIGETESLSFTGGNPVEVLIGQDRFYDLNSFREDNDERLGRVVTADLVDLNSRSRAGSISFLPEASWQVLEYTVHGSDGSVISSLTNVYTERNGELKLALSQRFDDFKSAQIRDQTQIEELNAEELQHAYDRCYLTGFGLPEPPTKGWPWYFYAFLLGFFFLAAGIVVRNRLTKKGGA